MSLPHFGHSGALQASCYNYDTTRSEDMEQRTKRTQFTPAQRAVLEKTFFESPYPSATKRRELSQELNVQEMVIAYWFAHRRARDNGSTAKRKSRAPTPMEPEFPDGVPNDTFVGTICIHCRLWLMLTEPQVRPANNSWSEDADLSDPAIRTRRRRAKLVPRAPEESSEIVILGEEMFRSDSIHRVPGQTSLPPTVYAHESMLPLPSTTMGYSVSNSSSSLAIGTWPHADATSTLATSTISGCPPARKPGQPLFVTMPDEETANHAHSLVSHAVNSSSLPPPAPVQRLNDSPDYDSFLAKPSVGRVSVAFEVANTSILRTEGSSSHSHSHQRAPPAQSANYANNSPVLTLAFKFDKPLAPHSDWMAQHQSAMDRIERHRSDEMENLSPPQSSTEEIPAQFRITQDVQNGTLQQDREQSLQLQLIEDDADEESMSETRAKADNRNELIKQSQPRVQLYNASQKETSTILSPNVSPTAPPTENTLGLHQTSAAQPSRIESTSTQLPTTAGTRTVHQPAITSSMVPRPYRSNQFTEYDPFAKPKPWPLATKRSGKMSDYQSTKQQQHQPSHSEIEIPLVEIAPPLQVVQASPPIMSTPSMSHWGQDSQTIQQQYDLASPQLLQAQSQSSDMLPVPTQLPQSSIQGMVMMSQQMPMQTPQLIASQTQSMFAYMGDQQMAPQTMLVQTANGQQQLMMVMPQASTPQATVLDMSHMQMGTSPMQPYMGMYTATQQPMQYIPQQQPSSQILMMQQPDGQVVYVSVPEQQPQQAVYVMSNTNMVGMAPFGGDVSYSLAPSSFDEIGPSDMTPTGRVKKKKMESLKYVQLMQQRQQQQVLLQQQQQMLQLQAQLEAQLQSQAALGYSWSGQQ